MRREVIVNATALDRSGALSILRQFVENIPLDDREWLIFVSPQVSITTENPNIQIVPIRGVKPMHKRLWWDAFGLKKWLRSHKIDPIASISLQNTGFNVGKDIPSFIYYHQALPFYPYYWNPLKKEHKTLWFYKHIYPFFVKLFLKKDTTVFVQLDFIKDGFIRRFNHPNENVKVFSPSVANITESADKKLALSDGLNLFYPATNNFYKNHRILYEAIRASEDMIHLYVTIPSKESNVSSTGVIPFNQVCNMYRQCDALVFPSYIETFGLPLLEAALTGMPIIVADLPYAREVLTGYEGVTYVQYDSPKSWENAIKNLQKGKRFNPIDISRRPGWKELFENIKKTIS